MFLSKKNYKKIECLVENARSSQECNFILNFLYLLNILKNFNQSSNCL